MSQAGRTGATRTVGTCGALCLPHCLEPATFYSQFDAVVLLSAPADVLLRRIESRLTNAYGKAADERDLVLRHLAEVEPLLRATCTHEIDATQPVEDVVAELVAIGGGNVPRPRAAN